MPFDEAPDHGGGGGGGDPHDQQKLDMFVDGMMQAGEQLGRALDVCPACSAVVLIQHLTQRVAENQSAEYKATLLKIITDELENKNVH